jgi:hypothetical protein
LCYARWFGNDNFFAKKAAYCKFQLSDNAELAIFNVLNAGASTLQQFGVS